MGISEEDTVRIGDIVLGLVSLVARDGSALAVGIDFEVASIQIEGVCSVNVPLYPVSVMLFHDHGK